ncbi:hypothetical protein D3C73_1106540 [compost metagenome]
MNDGADYQKGKTLHGNRVYLGELIPGELDQIGNWNVVSHNFCPIKQCLKAYRFVGDNKPLICWSAVHGLAMECSILLMSDVGQKLRRNAVPDPILPAYFYCGLSRLQLYLRQVML